MELDEARQRKGCIDEVVGITTDTTGTVTQRAIDLPTALTTWVTVCVGRDVLFVHHFDDLTGSWFERADHAVNSEHLNGT